MQRVRDVHKSRVWPIGFTAGAPCHVTGSKVTLVPTLPRFPGGLFLGTGAARELCGRWQSSAEGQRLLTPIFECDGKAGNVRGGSSPVVKESRQRETVLVGLPLSRGLVSILWVEKWSRNPVPLLS